MDFCCFRSQDLKNANGGVSDRRIVALRGTIQQGPGYTKSRMRPVEPELHPDTILPSPDTNYLNGVYYHGPAKSQVIGMQMDEDI
ncbi:hypothetical protein MMC21_007197 [Puttea exsequens]|nr:hypothetical protein [Puttea exsequens]